MNAPLTVGSLFAGIGGFDLGLERAGMRSVWQSEIDPYCQRVLAKHWPDVLRVPDVRDVGAGTVPYVDVICGGFPCQDLSYAGKGAGLDGARSGLWSEYARIVGELRPRYVVVENVAALLARGLGTVLADLAALGYDAEWDCIPASAVGAPHRRDRLWVVAYPNPDIGRQSLYAQRNGEGELGSLQREQRRDADGLCDAAADARCEPTVVGDANVARLEGRGRHDQRPDERPAGPTSAGAGDMGDPNGLAGATGGARQGRRGEVHEPGALQRTERPSSAQGHQWESEPDVGRVAHGVPARVDRLRALGNALVPQIAEWLGRRILSYEANASERAA